MVAFKKLLLLTIGQIIPSDIFARRFPVSTKGVLIYENKILLLKNEREEWDLPGGKLNRKETLENCLKREIKEETNLEVNINKLIGATVHDVIQKIDVVILFYLCDIHDVSMLNISSEHFDLGFFNKEDIKNLNINKKLKSIIFNALEDN